MSDRIRFGGRPFRKAIRDLTVEASVMVKAMAVGLEKSRTFQRRDAVERLADINVRATAMAASGQLSGYEAALLDGAIARVAEGIRGL